MPPRYRVPACPAQGPGYREQQVPSQDGPTEAALHLPGYPALHRGSGGRQCPSLPGCAWRFPSAESGGPHRVGTQVSVDAPLLAQSGEYQEETIRFGLECMYLDSWARQRTYQAFKEVLGSGIRHHLQVGARRLCRGGAGPVLAGADRPPFLQNNDLLREIFGLGPPLVLDAAALKASKVSRFEKVGVPRRTRARSPFLQHRGLQPSSWVWWVPAGGWAAGHPLTRPSFSPLAAPLQLGCLQSPHESPEPGAGQTGRRAVTDRRGQSPQPPWTADPAL